LKNIQIALHRAIIFDTMIVRQHHSEEKL